METNEETKSDHPCTFKQTNKLHNYSRDTTVNHVQCAAFYFLPILTSRIVLAPSQAVVSFLSTIYSGNLNIDINIRRNNGPTKRT